MSLGEQIVLKPIVKIEIVGGPGYLKSDMLEGALLKFQYVHKLGKKQVPKITLEFDNSSGNIFNILVYAVGLKLKVRFGYEGCLSRPFIAPIKTVKASAFTDAGRPMGSPHPDTYGTVIMEAQAYDYLAHNKPDQDHYVYEGGPKPLSAIMRDVARSLGYAEKDTYIQEGLGPFDGQDGEEPLVNFTQKKEGETYITFLKRLASERGFQCDLANKKFHFHSTGYKTSTQESISYFMGPDLLSFSIEGDYALNTQKVKGKAIDPLKNMAIIVESGTGQVLRYSGLNQISHYVMTKDGKMVAGTDNPPDAIRPEDIVMAISAKAKQAAWRRLYAHAKSKWTLRMELVGNPVITPGVGLDLDNFGPVVDGTWYAEEVEQLIDGTGFTTRIGAKAKKPPSKGPGFITLVPIVEAGTGRIIRWTGISAGSFHRDKKGRIVLDKTAKGKDKTSRGQRGSFKNLGKPGIPGSTRHGRP